MPDSIGSAAQTRAIAEQVAEAVILKFTSEHPESRPAEIPAPLRWAAGIIAALFTAGVASGMFWLVSTVSDMQVTLARMDERIANGAVKDSRFEDLDRRVTKLETFHQGGAK